jgi:hypothetical protein
VCSEAHSYKPLALAQSGHIERPKARGIDADVLLLTLPTSGPQGQGPTVPRLALSRKTIPRCFGAFAVYVGGFWEATIPSALTLHYLRNSLKIASATWIIDLSQGGSSALKIPLEGRPRESGSPDYEVGCFLGRRAERAEK